MKLATILSIIALGFFAAVNMMPAQAETPSIAEVEHGQTSERFGTASFDPFEPNCLICHLIGGGSGG